MSLKYFMPAPGARVRKPDGALVDPAGEPLPMNAGFMRLIAAGDLVAVIRKSPIAKVPVSKFPGSKSA